MFRVSLIATALLASLIACTFAIPSTSMVRGSGDVVTVTPDLADFDQVVLSAAFQARITRGDSYDVVIRIDDNLQQYLDARVQGRTLVIGLKPNVGFNFGMTTLEADITMPAIVGLNASGASHATLSGFNSTSPLKVDLSGASRASGQINCGDADIQVSGAGDISLDGSAGDLRLELSGASGAELDGFSVQDAVVQLSGASHATVDVSGTLDTELSGASHLTYTGNPTLGKLDLSGASTIDHE
jgi:hypothetical protein